MVPTSLHIIIIKNIGFPFIEYCSIWITFFLHDHQPTYFTNLDKKPWSCQFDNYLPNLHPHLHLIGHIMFYFGLSCFDVRTWPSIIMGNAISCVPNWEYEHMFLIMGTHITMQEHDIFLWECDVPNSQPYLSHRCHC